MASQHVPIRESVEAFLRQHDLLQSESPVLVAVSGGPDSMALLHLLRELDCPVHVAHFDHQTRSGQSTRDAAWVAEYADALEIPCHVGTADVPGLTEASPKSFEEVAREERYAYLAETAHEHGCAAIATGHHLNDQAETVLMRILRGTSVQGLGGIPPIRPHEGIAVIRPLLDVTRDAIMAYLDECRIASLEDHSNRDPAFLRNRMRHDLIPALSADYNTHLSGHLAQLAEIARTENAFMETMLQAFRVRCMESDTLLNREAFRSGHPALQRRLIHDWAVSNGAVPDYVHIDQAVRFVEDAQAGKNFDLGHFAQLSNGREQTALVVLTPQHLLEEPVALAVPGETTAWGRHFLVRPYDADGRTLRETCTATFQVVRAEALQGDVVVRHRRDGDRFSPMGMDGTRKVKDYLSDRGVPVALRDSIPIVAVEDTIVWIVGHAVSGHAALRDSDGTGLAIEVHHAPTA
jgi:tRNA(Ile)-lysidine synthase